MSLYLSREQAALVLKTGKRCLVALRYHAILLAVIPRASILVLASVVSFLATQPVPARVQMSGESYAILWQMEAGIKRPAPTRILKTPSRPYGTTSAGLAEFVVRAQQTSILPRNPRAPPLFSSQI